MIPSAEGPAALGTIRAILAGETDEDYPRWDFVADEWTEMLDYHRDILAALGGHECSRPDLMIQAAERGRAAAITLDRILAVIEPDGAGGMASEHYTPEDADALVAHIAELRRARASMVGVIGHPR